MTDILGGISKAITPAQLLARLLTVDGAGSGLDADTVDGWSPPSAPVGPFGLPGGIGMPGTAAALPQRRYPDSLFRT